MLQGVLRPSTADQIASKLNNLNVPDDTPPSSPKKGSASLSTPGSPKGGSAGKPLVSVLLSPRRKGEGKTLDSSSDDEDEVIGVVSNHSTRAFQYFLVPNDD